MAIKYCGKSECVQPYQDKLYGAGFRVHNQCNSASGSKKFRCTKCLNEISQDGGSKKK